jgi:2,3-bisphosphoglycerate-independent phosphoglycerate mutase
MLLDKMSELKTGKLATIVGRYFAMDRDKRWERTEKAYRALVSGQGELTTNPESAIQASYNNKVTDEFIKPIIIGEKSNGRISGRIQNNDAVILYNFRADRARQLSFALTDPDFKDFKTGLRVSLTGMCWYHNDLKAGIAFLPQSLSNILGEIVSQTGKRQLRIAETEKYAHVTFFFNGGNEVPFKNEDRVLIPSPKVATYDLKPEMSALEVTDKVVEAIDSGNYELIILNYANCDMVGHTGVLSAAVKAVETVDACAARVVDATLKKDGAAIITADHGNCEMMVDYRTGEPHTYHTTFVVPLCIVKNNFKKKLKPDGRLANIAPTILELLNLPQPPEMNQESLIIP